MGTQSTTAIEPFGHRLKRLRRAKGLSVKELALQLKIAETTYREWEYGRAIQGEPYPAIAIALGVGLTELLTGESPKADELFVHLSSVETGIKELRRKLESLY